MEYALVSGGSFLESVRQMIELGWTPLGPPFVNLDGTIVQAMTRLGPVEYIVTTACDENRFEEQVAKLVREGWKLQGGVSISAVFAHWEGLDGWNSETTHTYAQAFWREKQG